MIKARLALPGGDHVLLGLSRGNIERLTAGQPISVDLHELLPAAPPGTVVDIIFGETEDAMEAELKAMGLDIAGGKARYEAGKRRG